MKKIPAPQIIADRRKSAVELFLRQGFPPERAVRLAAMYLAALKRQDATTAAKKQAANATDTALSPIWTPPKGLAPHERLAARIAEFGRMSSEKAFQLAAKTARAADAGGTP